MQLYREKLSFQDRFVILDNRQSYYDLEHF